MSTHFGVYCTSCESGSGTSWNHGEFIIQAMLKALPHIKAAKDADTSGLLEIRFLGDDSQVLEWALDHWKHHEALVPKDEYGDLYERAPVAQSAEHIPDKNAVAGSNPVGGRHSPEPWSCDNDRSLYDKEGINLIEKGAADVMRFPGDAVRVVACVNACKGIPTEQLTFVIEQGLRAFASGRWFAEVGKIHIVNEPEIPDWLKELTK